MWVKTAKWDEVCPVVIHSTFGLWRRDGSPSNKSIGTRRCGQRRGVWQKLSWERWCNAAFGVMVLPSPSSGCRKVPILSSFLSSFNHMHLYAEWSGELGGGWEVRARQGWSPCAPRRLSTLRVLFPWARHVGIVLLMFWSVWSSIANAGCSKKRWPEMTYRRLLHWKSFTCLEVVPHPKTTKTKVAPSTGFESGLLKLCTL